MNELAIISAYIGRGSHDMGTAAWIGLGIIGYIAIVAFACLLCANGKDRGE